MVGRTLAGVTEVDELAMSPDGMFVAAGNHDQHVVLFDIAAGTSRTLAGGSFTPRALAFSPDGATLAVATQAHTIDFYLVSTGRNFRQMRMRGNAIRLTYTANGRWLIVATFRQGIVAISAETGQPVLLGPAGPAARVRAPPAPLGPDAPLGPAAPGLPSDADTQ
jgi:WD40 repeat protein